MKNIHVVCFSLSSNFAYDKVYDFCLQNEKCETHWKNVSAVVAMLNV